jgi:hypothetical protein
LVPPEPSKDTKPTAAGDAAAASVPDTAGASGSTSAVASVPDATAEGKPKWPLTMCDHCGAVDDWREMPSKKVFTSDTEWHHVRSCIACFAKERGVSEQEAMGIILEECPGFRSKERRASKFAKARAEAKEQFPALTSYLELRDISLKMMEGLFADFLDIFALKAGHLDQLDAKLEEQKALIKEIKLAKTSEQARELMIKPREIHERDELLAWKERCTDKQTGQVDTVLQDRFIMASSYADEWTSSLYGHFRFWYICLARTGDWLLEENMPDTCRRLTLSKMWDTLHADPLAVGQRWYCSCVAKYAAKWGVLVEMKFNSEQGVRYFRADVPDDHIKDALSTHHEKTLGDQVVTPEDLYEKMKSVPPTVTKVIEEIDRAKGIYRVIRAQDLDTIPTWEWYDLFTLTGRTLPPKPVSKRSKRNKKATYS